MIITKFKRSFFVLVMSLTVLASNCLLRAGNVVDDQMDKMWGDNSTAVDSSLAERAQFFDNSNYGMFIHWGLFSQLGGVWKDKTYYGIGEWIQNNNMADIPVPEYMAIANDFNPTDFDAMKIAQLAKDAGMKYIIITSKHHEGFAMFKSDHPFNVVDATPFGRDPMKELSEACKALDLGFGFYYSHNQDWTTSGATNGPALNEKGEKGTFKEYFYAKCKPQVKEICSNYGDLDFVWFDTPGNMPKEYVMELVDMVRELQPKALLCSRVGYGLGDYASKGDMEVPPRNIEGLWETCDTNNDSWSYAWYDNNFKSPTVTLQRLISTVGRGGTYLFNVGPNAKGNIPEIGVEFLQKTGEWIAKYPQVIYGAGASPWGHKLAWGDVVTQKNSLLLSVYDWPQDGKIYLPGIETNVKSAKLLKGKKSQSLRYQSQDGWIILDVPYKPAETYVTVIELELDMPASKLQVDQAHGIYPNSTANLLVEFANVTGAEKKSINWMEKFGEWKHVTQVRQWTEDSKATWEVNVQSPGYYYVDLTYKGEGRLVWATTTDEGEKVQNQQAATEKYESRRMGILEFKTAGKHSISVSLVEGDKSTSSLKSVTVKPIML